MGNLARSMLAMLAVAFAGAAPAQTASQRVEKLDREYSYETLVQQPEQDVVPAVEATDEQARRFHEYRMAQQNDKKWFAAILGAIALTAHIVVLGYLKHHKQSASLVVSATGLIYIVFGTIMLVVIANSEGQLTAAIGVLGAIAGYLFGRFRREEPEGESDAAKS